MNSKVLCGGGGLGNNTTQKCDLFQFFIILGPNGIQRAAAAVGAAFVP